MICIVDRTTDPYWNLAAEEYLLKNFSEPVFRLWRNAPSVIVGRHQNTLAEVDASYVASHCIPVVRRLTGGGAVFHDLGNVNFTFIENTGRSEDTQTMFRRFTAPIIAALQALGVDARLEGRNDLMIGGRKFSGNSMCLEQGRILQHGCMLFDASVEDLSSALRSHPEKFRGKAVSSNRSRVTNISEHLPRPITVEQFIEHLRLHVAADAQMYEYTQADLAAIDSLCETSYRRDEWNYGASPRSSFSTKERFAGGTVELYAEIDKDCIASLKIFGDYFFTLPTEEFCEALNGVRLTREEIASRLSGLPVGLYFAGVSAGEILELFEQIAR